MNLSVSYGEGVFAVAWLSFQPDGSISFGLRDRTFVLASARIRNNLWNAYNRITIQYIAPKANEPLLPVENPHFTFHPIAVFHLKSNNQRVSLDEEIFSGIADVGMTLEQQPEMPWIRATTAPINELKPAAGRADGIDNEDLVAPVPAILQNPSAAIEVDFIRAQDVRAGSKGPAWEYEWHGIGIRVAVKSKPGQIATLSWFHSS